ncbi:type I-F CRISPR-associated endoribonuclease Cas6/Csy4 [Serratia sp. NA_112.1]|uniref:type I-F CRISPR-associated endoribonuclease Cas6/Csy4 n=1 Tax=unclassified Serratia (in: enterobacteria) TaxID=2647522 RepID=UPI004046D9EF
MDHYQDICVLPDPEFSEPMLMAALFAKLHRALAADGQGKIGVSFPDMQRTPGAVLRLHGGHEALNELQKSGWLKGLRDYTGVGAIQAVPAGAQYRTVSRVQVKSSVERLRRRAVSKGWLTEEQAKEKIPRANEQRSSLAFIALKSLSTGQSFRLFVKQGELRETPVEGRFSFYGLSPSATIPWF